MFNTEEIIELEKKWLNYKIKQKFKLYILAFFCISLLLVAITAIYLPKIFSLPDEKRVKIVEKKTQKKPLVKKELKVFKETNTTIENKITIPVKSEVVTEIIPPTKEVLKKDNSKPYHFKLIPTEQGSELFSSNGFLTLNLPYEQNNENIPLENKIVQSIKDIQSIKKEKISPKKKTKISIEMQEVDTIAYLKDKYYTTSSIVFALMLAEEYYYEKEYKNTLKWALTANDIDSQNTKSWYWFAKSKVKLNQKEDAVRALKAYLSNSSSKRLSTLLHKIELGDTND